MNKATKIVLSIAPVALCGCVKLIGPDADPAAQQQAVDTGTAVINAVAGVTGQGWAIPIISTVGAVLAGALNAHHGVRNVTVATAKGVAGVAMKLLAKKAQEPKA